MSTQAVSADGRGISRNFDSELNEYTGVIDKYIQDGDENRPHYEHSVEAISARKFEQYGGNLDAIAERVRTFLKARCTNESTMYPAEEKQTKSGSTFFPAQPVYLDLDGTADRIGRAWALPLPAIYFATLDPDRDPMFKKGSCEAIAVYFDPSNAEEERFITWNGRIEAVASDWDAACYEGIVRTFGSFAAMKQARRELSRALAEIRKPAPTDECEEADAYCTNAHLDEAPDIEFEGI